MVKLINEMTKDFKPGRKARIDKDGKLLLMEYDLVVNLRKDEELTQKELADILEIYQFVMFKLESQSDVLTQTLEHYNRALVGKLGITAKFSDREVKLNQFTWRDREELWAH